MKKIVLMSVGGSVGKTLFTTQVLHPHLPKAKILCVDSVNTTAKSFGIKNCELHSGDEFNRTYRTLMTSKDDVIVDVGGSKECKEFLDGMLALDGSDAITCIIVPSRPTSKDQGCALDTIERLIVDGVDKSKIKVIFTETKKSTEAEFSQLITGMKDLGLQPNLKLTIPYSALFGEMIEELELITNIINDPTDYKEKVANAAANDHTDYVGKLMRQKMARTVWPKLQDVYSNLFAE